jgi:RNA 2',3'-cyclic 3'-phosphodiesterase
VHVPSGADDAAPEHRRGVPLAAREPDRLGLHAHDRSAGQRIRLAHGLDDPLHAITEGSVFLIVRTQTSADPTGRRADDSIAICVRPCGHGPRSTVVVSGVPKPSSYEEQLTARLSHEEVTKSAQTRARVPASVAGDERLRLFLALRLPDAVLDRIVEWQPAALSGGRLVARENLHVTLAFLGHRPRAELDAIVGALRETAAEAAPIVLGPARYRETRSVGMLVLADEDGRAGTLARALHARLERLGAYEPEKREWLPHLTVLRFRVRPRLHPEPPSLEPFSPSDAAAYLSRLSPSGAQYEVLESFALGG